MMLVERPGYRIDSLKRGSRMSCLIVSFIESSNLCMVGIIFIGSYLSIHVKFWCLSCSSGQAQVHQKRISYEKLVGFFYVEGFPGFSLLERSNISPFDFTFPCWTMMFLCVIL